MLKGMGKAGLGRGVCMCGKRAICGSCCMGRGGVGLVAADLYYSFPFSLLMQLCTRDGSPM